MVGVRRFELLTSSVSGKRSPPELNARISAAGVAARSILRENAHVTQPSIASFSHITNTAQREGRGEGPRRQAGPRRRRTRLRRRRIRSWRRQTRPSQRPPNQTCGLIAVRREGPSRLPAILLGNVVARVLLTRRFPEGSWKQGQRRTKVSLGRQNDARGATLDVIPAKTSSPAPK